MKPITLLCAPFLCLLVSTVTAAKDPGAAMFRGNPSHTGVYDASGVPKLSGVKWKFHTNGYVISSPAVANGLAYVGSTDGNLYAVDLQAGMQLEADIPLETRRLYEWVLDPLYTLTGK